MRFWKEKYNLEKEDFLVAAMWVHLFSLPKEGWEEETLEGINNSIESFVKVLTTPREGGTLHMDIYMLI